MCLCICHFIKRNSLEFTVSDVTLLVFRSVTITEFPYTVTSYAHSCNDYWRSFNKIDLKFDTEAWSTLGEKSIVFVGNRTGSYRSQNSFVGKIAQSFHQMAPYLSQT